MRRIFTDFPGLFCRPDGAYYLDLHIFLPYSHPYGTIKLRSSESMVEMREIGKIKVP